MKASVIVHIAIMKVFLILSIYTALCAASVYPSIPGDNSHYVEGESRYIWMSDDSGVPQLVYLEEPVEESTTQSGANNQYFLFTRQNPDVPQQLFHGDINSVLNSFYNPSLPTKFISHGWLGSGFSRSSMVVKDAYLDTGDYNIISLDWNEIGDSGYVSAARLATEIGQYAGDFLVWLIGSTGADWNQVHLIGFSLGGHVIGSVGRTANGAAIRVTGLDVAGPLWQNNLNSLSPQDGQYVEGIHTDGRVTGIMRPVGHADFYPNGGRNPQPGCIINTCSHDRAFYFFASSIRTNHFVGRLCNNLEEAENNNCTGNKEFHMGNGLLKKTGAGLFGLTTTDKFPF